jgi:hypothetical protein
MKECAKPGGFSENQVENSFEHIKKGLINEHVEMHDRGEILRKAYLSYPHLFHISKL